MSWSWVNANTANTHAKASFSSHQLGKAANSSFQHSGCRCACNMNPMNSPSAMPPLWQEARTADGRPYYYNIQTKATQWTKPVELMNPVEVSILLLTLACRNFTVLMACAVCSALWQTNRGRNILLKADGNTGTTQNPGKVLGKCQRFTRMLLRRLRRPKLLLLRKFWGKACILL